MDPDTFIKTLTEYINSIKPQKLSGGSKPTLTLFYNPDCPHCKTFLPEFKKYQKRQNNRLKFEYINTATEHNRIYEFPTHVQPPGVPHVVLHVNHKYVVMPDPMTYESLSRFVDDNTLSGGIVLENNPINVPEIKNKANDVIRGIKEQTKQKTNSDHKYLVDRMFYTDVDELSGGETSELKDGVKQTLHSQIQSNALFTDKPRFTNIANRLVDDMFDDTIQGGELYHMQSGLRDMQKVKFAGVLNDNYFIAGKAKNGKYMSLQGPINSMIKVMDLNRATITNLSNMRNQMGYQPVPRESLAFSLLLNV